MMTAGMITQLTDPFTPHLGRYLQCYKRRQPKIYKKKCVYYYLSYRLTNQEKKRVREYNDAIIIIIKL